MRSPFVPVLVTVVALVAALVRWSTQGSGNLYTAFAKRFYVADPDLGWKVSSSHPVWLGLEVCAIILAIALGLVVAGWIIRKREAKTGTRATLLRAASWVVAVIPLAVPIAAFASGGAPVGARDMLPASQAVAIETGVTGALDLPAGLYRVLAHPGSVITAKLSAGHEEFDARFAGDIAGTITVDPTHLATQISAEISVATASVDTGIGERSKHAREEYLLAEQHPKLSFTLTEVIAARQDTPSVIAFRAKGTVALIGKTHVVEVTGTMTKPDAAGLARLGLDGNVMIVVAQFALSIKETALAADASDFDGDRIPIQISLVLRHASEASFDVRSPAHEEKAT